MCIRDSSWPTTSIAELHGEGAVEVLEDDVAGGRVKVRVRGTQGPTRLLFGIAGFPRWSLRGPGGPIEWVEAPAAGYGPGATQQERLDGSTRGGKVNGDDGTEPTLIATDVTDGDYTLTYQRWRPADVVAALVSLLALALSIVLLGWPRRATGLREFFSRQLQRISIVGHQVVWAAAMLAACGGLFVKVQRGHTAEAHRAVGLVRNRQASVLQHVHAGFTKADMLLRPALVFDRRHTQPAIAAFESVTPGAEITGWVALEDDDTKRKRHGNVSVHIEVRAAGKGDWTTLFDKRLPHRPGRIHLELPLDELADQPIDVRISSIADGKRAPELGVALELNGGGT
ncbi:MAG: hypothetical protein KUG77_24580 [Nannocystaceae bacterium]|nr:hypothetical protein [Nannocystaceae bacterium]